MNDLAEVKEMHLGATHYRSVVGHGLRKLRGEYRPGETHERKAYGLLGGRPRDTRIDITHVFCLARNARFEPPYRQEMDELMTSLAVPSETPLQRRGWLTDPEELLDAERRCEAANAVIFASYHMHRVSWAHDPRRDTCTAIDTALAEGTGLWVVILSLVDPQRPILRAFFEGDNDREARVVVGSD